MIDLGVYERVKQYAFTRRVSWYLIEQTLRNARYGIKSTYWSYGEMEELKRYLYFRYTPKHRKRLGEP